MKKIEKMKKKNFQIFHPSAHPTNPHLFSAWGVKIKNRKRQPESISATSIHAKFQAIWSSGFLWGFPRVEKSSPQIMIQGSLYFCFAPFQWQMEGKGATRDQAIAQWTPFNKCLNR